MLRKPVILALIATVLGIGTTAGTILLNWRKVLPVEDTSSGYAGRPDQNKIKGKPWDFWTDEIDNLSAELKAERAALDTRAKDLDAAAQRIASEKVDLQKQRTELEALRDEITRAIPEIKASEKQNIKTLAKTYASMKPSQAVAVLAEMDDANIVKLLSVMKPDVVGGIFQEMARTSGADGLAARAAHLSDQLRLVKKEDKEAAAQ